MPWHLQVTSYTARHFDGGDALARYNDGDDYSAVAQVEMIGRTRAFVHAVLRSDGGKIMPHQWLELVADLYAAGIREVLADRGKQGDKTWNLATLLARSEKAGK